MKVSTKYLLSTYDMGTSQWLPAGQGSLKKEEGGSSISMLAPSSSFKAGAELRILAPSYPLYP